jgi:iron-regulated transporter 1
MIFASGGRIATTGIDLAVCRDWVLVITGDSNASTPHDGEPTSNPLLTLLTTSLRQITLICKLVAPLLISLLTTTIGYEGTAASLIGLAMTTLVAEVVWLRVVWRKFDVLEQAEVLRKDRRATEELTDGRDQSSSEQPSVWHRSQSSVLASAGAIVAGWNEFRKMPVFLSKRSSYLHCASLTLPSDAPGSISM